MLSDNYEGIIEMFIKRTNKVEEILARVEGPSMFAKEHDSRFLPGISKEDSSTCDQVELIIGERMKRLKGVRDYQPHDIDMSHMQDALNREPQFPGGL